jgi:hypothetical protein
VLPIWVALIAAGAAILSSVLTGWLTHHFEHRRRRTEHELRWLEERFSPALNFLGRLDAIISSIPNTSEERAQMAERIEQIVVGQSKENNAWTIGLLLDPEQTGLSDIVLSAMTYGRIADSKDEYTAYLVRIHLSLQKLAEEFRRQRQAITSGKSLESMITQRKAELDRHIENVGGVLHALRSFAEDEEGQESTIQQIRETDIRGAELTWALDLVLKGINQNQRDKIEVLKSELKRLGWLNKLPAQ